MIELTVHLPEREYQALQMTAQRRGESIDRLIARCLALANTLSRLPPQDHWPPGFFEQTAGCLANDPLHRQAQGLPEQRLELQ
jgi:hypothetical protein